MLLELKIDGGLSGGGCGGFRLEDGKAERCWNPIRIVQNQATGELMDPQFFGTISDLLPLAVGDLWPILGKCTGKGGKFDDRGVVVIMRPFTRTEDDLVPIVHTPWITQIRRSYGSLPASPSQ